MLLSSLLIFISTFLFSYEGTLSSVNRSFEWDIYQFVELRVWVWGEGWVRVCIPQPTPTPSPLTPPELPDM